MPCLLDSEIMDEPLNNRHKTVNVIAEKRYVSCSENVWVASFQQMLTVHCKNYFKNFTKHCCRLELEQKSEISVGGTCYVLSNNHYSSNYKVLQLTQSPNHSETLNSTLSHSDLQFLVSFHNINSSLCSRCPTSCSLSRDNAVHRQMGKDRQ